MDDYIPYLQLLIRLTSCTAFHITVAQFRVKMYNIAVVGAGISGITTAYTIKEHLGPSVHITMFTENESPNTTSDIAAGAITPYIWGTMTEEESM